MTTNTADSERLNVAIVDYEMGNLFSVSRACAAAGMDAAITSEKRDILAADAVIIPGVGAFGDAMTTLQRLDLVSVLRDLAQRGTPLAGICLGLQLLMTESEEFGRHRGLDIIPGTVRRLRSASSEGRNLKVPQVGWNRISPPASRAGGWNGTVLEDIPEGEFMYFVHSYFVEPESHDLVLSATRYGELEFCSSIQSENLFACQFHPERSGPVGMQIYDNIRKLIMSKRTEASHVAK
jgi:glutamine amidotransferase